MMVVLDTNIVSETRKPAPDPIVLARGFTVATHDTSPFEAAGLAVIDPWEYA